MKNTIKNGCIFRLLDGPSKKMGLKLIYIPLVNEKLSSIAEKICAYAKKYHNNVLVIDNNFGIVDDSKEGGFDESNSTVIATPDSTPEDVMKMFHQNNKANSIREGVLNDRFWQS